MAERLFPAPYRAAISLTYDDGLHQHLDHAMPDLESIGCRGTFYISTHVAAAWPGRIPEWKDGAARGHEIANHSMNHPCSNRMKWVKPDKCVEVYDMARIEAELVEASRELKEGVGEEIESYAYPCGDDYVGPERESYRPVVGKLFPSARGTGSQRGMVDFATVDWRYVPAFTARIDEVAEPLIEFVDQVIEAGSWGIFVFHGVGGGHNINVTRETHQRVLQHLHAKKDQLWCAPFREVAAHCKAATTLR